MGRPRLSPNPLGEQRILVVCLPDTATIESKLTNPLYSSIDWSGFKERDLVILEFRKYTSHIVSEHRRKEIVPRALTTHSWYYESDHAKMMTLTRCKNKIEYVLIGKDTGVKMRWDLFPPNDELYELIDSMPMRRFEMRKQKEKN